MEGDKDTSAARAIIQMTASKRVNFTTIADVSESNSNNMGGVVIDGSNPTTAASAVNGVLYNGQFNTGGTYTN